MPANCSDESIILRTGEAAVQGKRFLVLFSRERGLATALVEGSKMSLYSLQRGMRLKVDWKNNQSRQFCKISYDVLDNSYPLIFKDVLKVLSLDLLLEILAKALPESEISKPLYEEVSVFLVVLQRSANWYQHYIELLLFVMEVIGLPLQLNRCAVHPESNTEIITYICSETGVGLCEWALRGYDDNSFFRLNKLLKNSFYSVLPKQEVSLKDFLEALKILIHFLYTRYLQTRLPVSFEVLCTELSA